MEQEIRMVLYMSKPGFEFPDEYKYNGFDFPFTFMVK